ncbi:MAG: hypothetical protein ACE5H2_05335 [Terriglobia bacterium]
MRVTLNLATQPAAGGRAFWLLASLLGSGVLALTVWVGVQGWRSWQEGTSPATRGVELRGQLAKLTRRQQEYAARLRTPAAQEVLERVAFYNHLLDRKTVSWAELFVALERQLPARVRILAIAPELEEDNTLRLELRVAAESAPALVKFLRGLEQGAAFAQVEVRSQQRGTRTGEDAIIAQVRASYLGRP